MSVNPVPPKAKATKPKGKAKVAPVKRQVWRAGIYACPKCRQSVGILVDMTAPPVCWNHKNHSVVEMEKE